MDGLPFSEVGSGHATIKTRAFEEVFILVGEKLRFEGTAGFVPSPFLLIMKVYVET
jgi:hypothetical protein